jgi:hypothetical protein
MSRNFQVFNLFVCSELFVPYSLQWLWLQKRSIKPWVTWSKPFKLFNESCVTTSPCWFYTFFPTQVPLLHFLQARWEWQKLNKMKDINMQHKAQKQSECSVATDWPWLSIPWDCISSIRTPRSGSQGNAHVLRVNVVTFYISIHFALWLWYRIEFNVNVSIW